MQHRERREGVRERPAVLLDVRLADREVLALLAYPCPGLHGPWLAGTEVGHGQLAGGRHVAFAGAAADGLAHRHVQKGGQHPTVDGAPSLQVLLGGVETQTGRTVLGGSVADAEDGCETCGVAVRHHSAVPGRGEITHPRIGQARPGAQRASADQLDSGTSSYRTLEGFTREGLAPLYWSESTVPWKGARSGRAFDW